MTDPVATPFNEALTALVKGREAARIREVAEPDVDFDAMEAAVGPMPGAT